MNSGKVGIHHSNNDQNYRLTFMIVSEYIDKVTTEYDIDQLKLIDAQPMITM